MIVGRDCHSEQKYENVEIRKAINLLCFKTRGWIGNRHLTKYILKHFKIINIFTLMLVQPHMTRLHNICLAL